MQSSLVLTVIGSDRPGIVQCVSAIVATHGGSWQQSRMARLAGQFAGILRVSVPAEQVDALTNALRGLAADGLQVQIAGGADDAPTSARARWTLDVMGRDRAGIVKAIAAVLAAHGVNVLELESEVLSAPMSGAMMFKAVAVLMAPPQVDHDTVHDELEALDPELHVDLQVDEG